METARINSRIANYAELKDEDQQPGVITVDTHFNADFVIEEILKTIALNYNELSGKHIAAVVEAMRAAGNKRSLADFMPSQHYSQSNHFLRWYGCPEAIHWLIDVYSLDTYVAQCIKIHNLYAEGYLPLYNDWIDNLQVYAADKFAIEAVMEYNPLTDCVNKSLRTLFDEFPDFEFNNYGWYMTLVDITEEFLNAVASCEVFSNDAESNDDYIRKNRPFHNVVTNTNPFKVFSRYRALLDKNSYSPDFVEYEESLHKLQTKGHAAKGGFYDSRFDARLWNKPASHKLECWKQDFVKWMVDGNSSRFLQIDGEMFIASATKSVEHYCMMAKNIGERDVNGVFDKPIFGKQKGLNWNEVIGGELSRRIGVGKCCLLTFREHGIEVVKGKVVAGESLFVSGTQGIFIPHEGKPPETPVYVGINETGAIYCNQKFLLIDPKSISFTGHAQHE